MRTRVLAHQQRQLANWGRQINIVLMRSRITSSAHGPICCCCSKLILSGHLMGLDLWIGAVVGCVERAYMP